MKISPGPGVLVAAAFIGPGTVTACTLAGADFGYALIWALVFATIATIILQDMAARLGVGARLGLGEALMQAFGHGAAKWIMVALVFTALAVGNAAYQAGNLAGAALGYKALIANPLAGDRVPVLLLAGFASTVLYFGRYRLLERLLLALVMLMSTAFVITALITRPDWSAIATGLLPQVPPGGLITAIALIGTTIVPYNLFLHASASRQRWESINSLATARTDAVVSIGFGGLISILIVSTAAASLFQSGVVVNNAADMALSIEPAFGAAARYLIGFGLLAAGLTSAITAPMATGYALSEILGTDKQHQRKLFRATALSVVAFGAALALLGIKPVSLILLAQYANGLLLPIMAIFLLLIMNRKSVLGEHVNGIASNIAGAVVVIVTLGLGLRSILRAAGLWL
ncbi:MAG: Nramp family divalent metal transporter [Arenicella sp.]|nr:Nramp family divalent metal transporter [Arenicella sp.]